jgi:hypothetical protein
MFGMEMFEGKFVGKAYHTQAESMHEQMSAFSERSNVKSRLRAGCFVFGEKLKFGF